MGKNKVVRNMVMLEQCAVQIDEMQGAAEGGSPMQATPNGVVEAGQRSRLAISTSSVQYYMLRTTSIGVC